MVHHTFRPLLAALSVGMASLPTPARADLMALVRPSPSTTTVVLLDRSQSISPDDRALAEASIRNAGRSLRAGDRLIIGEIGDAGAGEFRPVMDVRVPVSDVRLRREAAETSARATVEQRVTSLLAAGKAARTTRIIEAIAAAAPALRGANGMRARLVVVSDAVEESPIANLARRPVSAAETNAALQKARALGLLPDLRGVELSFAGAGGAHYGANRNFWTAYASQTGATIVRYGRFPFESGERAR